MYVKMCLLQGHNQSWYWETWLEHLLNLAFSFGIPYFVSFIKNSLQTSVGALDALTVKHRHAIFIQLLLHLMCTQVFQDSEIFGASRQQKREQKHCVNTTTSFLALDVHENRSRFAFYASMSNSRLQNEVKCNIGKKRRKRSSFIKRSMVKIRTHLVKPWANWAS